MDSVNYKQAHKLYRELVDGKRQRLPNGYWEAVGRTGASHLLRDALQKDLGMTQEEIRIAYKRDLLVRVRLNSAAQVLYNNNHFDYLIDAFPQFKDKSLANARDQVQKNENYFDKIDTERKAYLLGLLAADGNITDKNQISLWVKIHDAELVDFMGKELELRPYRRKNRSRDGTTGVVVCSAKLSRALAKHEIIPRKSLKIKWPKTVPNNLERHYMRGLIDGDGSVSDKQWTFVGGNRAFAEEFRKRAEAVIAGKIPLNKTGNNWLVTGGRNTWLFLDWLYEDATFYLTRKHEGYLKGQKSVQKLKAISSDKRRKTGRRGYSVEVQCSMCSATMRVPESKVKNSTYVFCNECQTRGFQKEIHNQGWKPRASPKRKRMSDKVLRRALSNLMRKNGGRLPPFEEIKKALGNEVGLEIKERGGLSAVARKWNLRTAIRSRGELDSLETLLEELKPILENLSRFPGDKDLRDLDRYDLLNAIQKKHGGLRMVRKAMESMVVDRE